LKLKITTPEKNIKTVPINGKNVNDYGASAYNSARSFTASTYYFAIVIIALLSIISGCNKTPATKNKTPKPIYQATGKEGKISGAINFAGTPQMPSKIDMNADAACVGKNPNATVETQKVKDGKLANVLVYIKEGKTADGKNLNELGFQTEQTQAKLDQDGCVYVPRVLGLQTGQKLLIHNSDETVHTTQAMSEKNYAWYTTQKINSAPIEKTFTESEIIIPLKCTQHGWMAAYVAVFEHPFFAVTKDDGIFEINNVPAGTYTIAAWHEKGGAKGTEKTAQLTIKEGEQATLSFDWDNSTKSGASLMFLQPLELTMPFCK